MYTHPYLGLRKFLTYFGQDHSLWGETIPKIVHEFKNDNPSEEDRNFVLKKINEFIHEHPNNLDSAFLNYFGFEVNPKLWGHTAHSFLSEVMRLITTDHSQSH